jgi:flagellar biosynthetic protein FliR
VEEIIQSISKLPHFLNYFFAWIVVFPRFLGFIIFAPGFSRKEIPSLPKIGMAMALTITFLPIFGDVKPPASTSFFLAIFLNFIFGSIIGMITLFIFDTITAAGEMMNMQMGLQSAMMFDPNSKTQSSILGRFLTLFAVVIFIDIGGLYWLIEAFIRGFEIFPLYDVFIPLDKIINMKYLIYLTGNVMFIGLQIASPIIITTLCQDIILGIISKTAPQVNVFQLSFLFKPLIGSLIIVIILPLLVNTIIDYFHYFSKIY